MYIRINEKIDCETNTESLFIDWVEMSTITCTYTSAGWIQLAGKVV
jgi:hypothetical protein